MMSTFEFGEWLRRSREERGWSQTELAEMLGVRPAQISRIESGERGASLEMYVKIAELFQYPLGELIRMASGYNQKKKGKDLKAEEKIEQLNNIAEELPTEGIDDLLQFAKFQLREAQERRRNEANVATKQNQRARISHAGTGGNGGGE